MSTAEYNQDLDSFGGVSVFLLRENFIWLSQRVSCQHFPNCWQSPGGGVEAGEDRKLGALRELEEETGLGANAEELVYVSKEKHTHPDKPEKLASQSYAYIHHFFVLELSESSAEPDNKEPDKHGDWQKVPLIKFFEMPESSVMPGSKDNLRKYLKKRDLLRVVDPFASQPEENDRPRRPFECLTNWHPRAENPTPKLVVNIIGPNGGGKSVLPKALCNLDPDHYWVNGESGDKILTVCPNLGFGLVGYYRTKCGGGDSLEKKEIMEALFRLCQTDLHIIVEGSIISNTKNTYWDTFRGIKEHFPERRPLFVVMDYPYETYLERIMARNGGKPIKEALLRDKFNNITKYARFWEEDSQNAGIEVHRESSAGLPELFASMRKAFDQVVGVETLPRLNTVN